MIGLSLISNPSELGPIRTLAKRDRLFNPQVFQVEFIWIDLNECTYLVTIKLDTCLRLTEINTLDQIQRAFDIQLSQMLFGGV